MGLAVELVVDTDADVAVGLAVKFVVGLAIGRHGMP